jgi:hypothetical protein
MKIVLVVVGPLFVASWLPSKDAVIASGANPNNHHRQWKADTYRTTDHHR